jgi:hypothetical protein
VGHTGAHAIQTKTDRFFLPKTRTVPPYVYETYKDRAGHVSNTYAHKLLKASTTKADGLNMTFERKDKDWVLVSKRHIQTVTRTRINRDAKKQHKGHIYKLRQWAMTMYPMMRANLNYELRTQMNKEITAWCKDNGVPNLSMASWGLMFDPKNSGKDTPALVRKILADEEHAMRYHLGVAAMFAVHDAVPISNSWGSQHLSEEEMMAISRRAFNKWINKVAGFQKITKESKE